MDGQLSAPQRAPAGAGRTSRGVPPKATACPTRAPRAARTALNTARRAHKTFLKQDKMTHGPLCLSFLPFEKVSLVCVHATGGPGEPQGWALEVSLGEFSRPQRTLASWRLPWPGEWLRK